MGTLESGRLMEGGRLIGGRLIDVGLYKLYWVGFRVQLTKCRIKQASDGLLFSGQKGIYSRRQFSNKGFRFPVGFFIQPNEWPFGQSGRFYNLG